MRSELSSAARALLARRAAPAAARAVQPRRDQGPARIANAQVPPWMLSELNPESPALNLPKRLRLRGSLDQRALERALIEIVARHEVLGSTFPAPNGIPLQAVRPGATIGVTAIDGRARPAEALAHLDADARRPFNLAADLPIRAALVRLEDDLWDLQITFHHVAFDGWSTGVFFDELRALYNAFGAGAPSPLAPLAIQSADIAAWERGHEAGRAADRAWWRDRLRGATTRLDLGADRPRPPRARHLGAQVIGTIPAILTARLTELAGNEGTTLFATAFAAWHVLVGRRAGHDDLIIGAVVAGRVEAAMEPLIGCFMNSVPIRVPLDRTRSFREHLRRIAAESLETQARQTVPIQKLARDLFPEWDPSHGPLLPVLFNFRNMPFELPRLHGLEVSFSAPPLGSTEDLQLNVTVTPSGLRCELDYDPDLFDAATAVRWLDGYRAVLDGIAADVETPIGKLAVMPGAERRRVIDEWNGPDAVDRPGPLVHQVIERRTTHAPGALGIIDADLARPLSYDEMNRAANRLAHHLRCFDRGSNPMIGVYLERSIDAVIALLAILKAGATYVPLDPEYPIERLAFMAADAQLGIVITSRRLGARLSLPEGARMLCLETEAAAIARQPGSNPDAVVDPEQLAYVIYTSGSTGQPKGVCIDHRALAAHVAAVAELYRLSPDDRVLQFASFSFDTALEQILPALAAGASVVLRGATLWDPADFSATISALGVTVVDLAPAYWQQWVTAVATRADPTVPKLLRLVEVGGDTMRVDSARSWFASPLSTIRLLNCYGPTEATITAATFELDSDTVSRCSRVPIGKPVPGHTMYLLDESRQPVPIGAPGEIYLGGPTVARGYWNRPELTAERFLPDPFSRRPNARLYRTGDVGRRLPSGDVQFEGRADDQVKIRGHRIELGEIERALQEMPGIAAAAAAVVTGPFGDPQIAAYYVL
ncbi:MAG: amino acid adenylation domain-containing protein, partial [Gemmatimonadota bacterium]